MLLSCLVAAGLFTVFGRIPIQASQIDLEPLRQDGYGMVRLKRPKPNVLMISGKIDGRKEDLVIDTGWSSDGISLRTDQAAPAHPSNDSETGFGFSATGKKMSFARKGRAQRVNLGEVELLQVPLIFASFRLGVGAEGVCGAGFLRTCSAIVDLQNLRLYLKPPGTGHRVVIEKGMRAAGLSETPFFVSPSGGCFVDVEINGARAKMVIDTGASLAGLDSRMAKKIGVLDYHSHTGYTDAAGAQGEAKLGRLRSFKIGNSNVHVPDIRLAEFGFYPKTQEKVVGLLGIDILGSNGAIIDSDSGCYTFTRRNDWCVHAAWIGRLIYSGRNQRVELKIGVRGDEATRADLASAVNLQAVDIQDFIAVEKIDPMYFYKPCFLEPQKGGDKVCALLRDVLTKTNKGGIS